MTFSIAARCPTTGMLGVATSSKALAAGGLVPYVKAGVAAIASQSFVNPYLGFDGLRFIEDGLPAERALERLVESDPGRDLRQLAIVDKDGRTAACTGERCVPWAGHVQGAAYVCLGNIIAGEEVVAAMARAYEGAAGDDFAERLLQALEAGQDAGGDRRGRQSAGISIYAEEEYPYCNLRVDDHTDPIPELRRVYDVFVTEELPFLPMMSRRDDFIPNWQTAVQAAEMFTRELDEQVPVTKES